MNSCLRSIFIIITLALSPTYSLLHADSFVWSGSCGTANWNQCCQVSTTPLLFQSNWTGTGPGPSCLDLYPRSGDTALISGSVTVPSNIVTTSVDEMIVAPGASLTLLNNLTLNVTGTNFGYIDWLRYGLIGSGTLSNYGTIDIGRTQTNTHLGAIIFNYGSMTWHSSSQLLSYLPYLGELHNAGTMLFNPQTNDSVTLSDLGRRAFFNQNGGTLISSQTGNPQFSNGIDTTAYNSGTVKVVSGSLYFGRGADSLGYSSISAGADYDLATGASLLFDGSGVRLIDSTHFKGNGLLLLTSSGSYELSGNNQIETQALLDNFAARLSIGGTTTFSGPLTLTRGMFKRQSSAGTARFDTSNSVTISSSFGSTTLRGVTWHNTGTVNWTNGDLRFSDDFDRLTEIVNEGFIYKTGVGHIVDELGDFSLDSTLEFKNRGLLLISSPGTTYFGDTTIRNSGEIQVISSSLNLDGWSVFVQEPGGVLACDAGILSSVLSGGSASISASLGASTPTKFGVKGQISLNFSKILFGEQSELSGEGTCSGVVLNAGSWRPGQSPGRFNVTGKYNQLATGTLNLEVQGVQPGQYDTIAITGPAVFGGTAVLDISPGLSLPVGTTLPLISASSVQRGFDAVRGLISNLSGGAVSVLEQNPTGFSLRIVQPTSLIPPVGLVLSVGRPRFPNVGVLYPGAPQAALVTGSAILSSSNPSVVAISSTGALKPLSPGNATITASFGGLQTSFPVTITSTRPRTLINRISKLDNGEDALGESLRPAMTGLGDVILFESDAAFIDRDTNGLRDIYRYDRRSGKQTLLTVNTSGQATNGHSLYPAINEFGKVYAWLSTATDLLAGQPAGLILYRMKADQVTPQAIARVGYSDVNLNPDPILSPPSFSSDGRFLAFVADNEELVSGDTNNRPDIFVYDAQTGAFVRVSIATGGAQSNGTSRFARISSSGRYVVFSSDSTNLVAGDTNGQADVFLHDRDPDVNGIFDESNGVTIRVNVDSAGTQATGEAPGFFPRPAISGDGQRVVWDSKATNLVAADTNNRYDVFTRDILVGTTRRLSLSSSGAQLQLDSYEPNISSDGKYATFSTSAGITSLGSNAYFQVYRVNLVTPGTAIELISQSTAGGLANGHSGTYSNSRPLYTAMSGTGQIVAFSAEGINLDIDDRTSTADLFVFAQ